jgi:hypothetical protein
VIVCSRWLGHFTFLRSIPWILFCGWSAWLPSSGFSAAIAVRPEIIGAPVVAAADKEEIVETLMVVLLIAAIAYWSFRHGKRMGSRLGFRAGRRKRRRRHR